MSGTQPFMTVNLFENIKSTGRAVGVGNDSSSCLKLSDDAVAKIRLIEESVVTAEDRLGFFRVG
ncbi:hypothetical protein HK11_12410 [Acetobacter sp. DmW_043]|uniref:hypothetical protein n=1 Tax=Acetobacter sp. DmW_043 TaxID=1670658 RepID=UPI000A378A8D|nr:hypothetical protein [Acetobacter sp. DmW_043]OUI86974.1 hypothetical protein HK11_12410 [Acetobacter sp. DmW_043]